MAYFASSSTINSSSNLYWDNTNNRLGIGNSSPSFTLDVSGTGRFTGIVTFGSTLSNGTYAYTLPSATGTLALTSAIPANPVGGTGTTNTIPKFTASSTIGDSAITDNGTTVTLVSRALSGTSATFSGAGVDVFSSSGIGTSAVSGLFRVVTAGTSSGIAIGQSNSTRYTSISANDYKIYNDDFFLTTNGAFPLSIGTNNTARLTISSTGAATFSSNVTIGAPTTDPTLTLNGDNAGGDSYINFKADLGTTKVQLLGTKNGGTGGRFTIKTLQASVLTNAMIIENENVGIGITPINKFFVNLVANQNIRFCQEGGQATISAVNDTASVYAFLNIDANVLRLQSNSSGNVSIGTATDFGYKLNLNGQPGANGYTAWTNWSDLRLKENITDLDATNVLDKISKIRPVTYNYNELSGFDEDTRSRRISGFIAQELMEVFPDMVSTMKRDDGGEYYDTNLSNLDLYLVKAIQELYKKLQRNNIN